MTAVALASALLISKFWAPSAAWSTIFALMTKPCGRLRDLAKASSCSRCRSSRLTLRAALTILIGYLPG